MALALAFQPFNDIRNFGSIRMFYTMMEVVSHVLGDFRTTMPICHMFEILQMDVAQPRRETRAYPS